MISQSDHSTLVTVIDPDEATGRELADRHLARWLPEPQDWTGIDAVVVAAPTHLHRCLTEEALSAGLPTLVEKPAAATLLDSQRIVDTAARLGVPLLCGFVERFNPAVVTARSIAEAPVHVNSVRHGPYAPRIRTGVAWDLLIHDVDSCLRMVGSEPKRVWGSTGRYHPTSLPGAEDISEAIIEFTGSAVATASASRISHRKVRLMTITELDRVIEADLLRRTVTIYRHVDHGSGDDDSAAYRQQTIIEIPELMAHREPLVAQWDHFCDLVAGTVDMVAERQTILPPHRVISDLCDQHPPP
ncbi:Gfo/Idh/MocA family protein [Stackebrandtia endophytica]|uniref:Gfo/Idh/MocA family protein n=1 Tax=Stackebrandtia endophytica TaxID=1496996 RepID=UPI001FE859D1|nr:Gfo/Idh/MocA family oxidoreductase [Stackebrandtia endophytica]